MSVADNIKELMRKKDDMEAEIKELMDVLESQKGVGLHERLVDSEGYPRADIDIYSVRHARQQVICLQNDHKALMKEIETQLHELHAEARQARSSQSDMEVDQRSDIKAKADFTKAFVKVDRVDAGSPAMEAGLEVHDLITQFGSVTKNNFENLQSIGSVVQHSKDRAVSVTVIRNGEEVHLALTPKTWSGKGLLGCNIVPIK